MSQSPKKLAAPLQQSHVVRKPETTHTIICADTNSALRAIPAESIDCIVTSPPYLGLRDYNVAPTIWDAQPHCIHQWGSARNGRSQSGATAGSTLTGAPPGPERRPRWQHRHCTLCTAWEGCLGHEPSRTDYVRHLTDICSQLHRVLKSNGTFWLNIADTLAHAAQGNPSRQSNPAPKSLNAVPELLTLALQQSGWILRTNIIWNKTNSQPDNAPDRPTISHENILFLTKRARYAYNSEAVAEPATSQPGTRNRRSVWNIPTSPYHGAHTAPFPVALPTICIAAGSPPNGVILDPFAGSGTTGIAAPKLGTCLYRHRRIPRTLQPRTRENTRWIATPHIPDTSSLTHNSRRKIAPARVSNAVAQAIKEHPTASPTDLTEIIASQLSKPAPPNHRSTK